MPDLTRRPIEGLKGWHVYFGDVRIGTIRKLDGVPTHGHQWAWSIGFDPGMPAGRRPADSASTFEEARAAFERAWRAIEPTLTEEDFEAWRRERDWTAWKYRMWKAGCQMPTQNESGWSKCFCGELIPIACAEHVYTAHRRIGA